MEFLRVDELFYRPWEIMSSDALQSLRYGTEETPINEWTYHQQTKQWVLSFVKYSLRNCSGTRIIDFSHNTLSLVVSDTGNRDIDIRKVPVDYVVFAVTFTVSRGGPSHHCDLMN